MVDDKSRALGGGGVIAFTFRWEWGGIPAGGWHKSS